MTSAPAATSEMDHLDELGAKAFDGYLVRKDLVRKYSRQYPVPSFVVEFRLGRYCASTDPAAIEAGLQIVEKQLQGRIKIIDIVRAHPDSRSGSLFSYVSIEDWIPANQSTRGLSLLGRGLIRAGSRGSAPPQLP